MPPTAITPREKRGSRVKLAGSILALVVLESGRQIRGRMNQLSVNGGLAAFEQPLDEGIRYSAISRRRYQRPLPRPTDVSHVGDPGMPAAIPFSGIAEESRAGLTRELEAMVRAGASQAEEEAE